MIFLIKLDQKVIEDGEFEFDVSFFLLIINFLSRWEDCSRNKLFVWFIADVFEGSKKPFLLENMKISMITCNEGSMANDEPLSESKSIFHKSEITRNSEQSGVADRREADDWLRTVTYNSHWYKQRRVRGSIVFANRLPMTHISIMQCFC